MKELITTAIWDGKYFRHFGIHPKTASLYGHSPEEIINVKLVEAVDQSRGKPMKDIEGYWSWWDSQRNCFQPVLTWEALICLDMCFPAGVEISEMHGSGQAYRVNVERI